MIYAMVIFSIFSKAEKDKISSGFDCAVVSVSEVDDAPD